MLWCPIILTQDVGVFPTCVGVFLDLLERLMTQLRLPHVRGGVSTYIGHLFTMTEVFPTCVGVFLTYSALKIRAHGLPHVRGGVSIPIH